MNKSKKRAHFKKERSDETVSTRLWAADHALFSEIVGRRHSNPAELLRQIVHEWAITIRLSGQNTDQPETAGPIRKLHEQILAEQLEPIHQTLAAICQRLNVRVSAIANTQDGPDPDSDADSIVMAQLRRVREDLGTTLDKVKRSKTHTIAHYNLSAQAFAANWAALKLIQRFIVEPYLRRVPRWENEANQMALAERDKGLDEGLMLVKHSAFHFHSSELFYNVIVKPTEENGEDEPSEGDTPIAVQ